MARSSRGKAEGINAKQEFQGRSTHREQPHTESERADRVQRGDVRDRVGMREEESETENTREQERVDLRAQGNERAGMWKEIRGKAGSCERNEEREGERERERAYVTPSNDPGANAVREAEMVKDTDVEGRQR